LLRLTSRFGFRGNSYRPTLSHALDPHHRSQRITTRHDITITITTTITDNTHSPREFGLREGIQISSHYAAHMERRLYDNSQFSTQYHGWTPTASSNLLRVSKAFTLTTTLALHFFGQIRSEGTNGGATKSLAHHSCFRIPHMHFASLYFITRVLLLFAWSIGLRRAPVFERARSEEVGYALERIHGSARSGGSFTYTRLASLIFNQNVRSIALLQAVALCSRFLPIKHSKPLHSPS
jgi:hypothetical protein